MSDTIVRDNWRGKAGVVLRLAVPTVLENFLMTVVGFVDTLLVARIGLQEVAAVGVTNAVVAVYIAVFMAMGIGTSSLVARYLGAGETGKASAIACQSTWLALALGLFFGLVSAAFAEPLLYYMGTEQAVMGTAIVYFQIVAVPSLLISLTTIFGSILRSAGDTRSPLKVGVWVNLLHIVLVYLLTFGFDGWSGWGIAGTAWATTLSRLAGTLALYAAVRKSIVTFSPFKDWAGGHTLPLLAISGPAVAERLIMRLGQLLYAGLIVRLGTDVYSAFLFGGNISYFSFMPGYGMAIAATTLVGGCVGAGQKREAYTYGIVIMGLAAVFMGLIGAIYFFLAPLAGSWFSQDRHVIEMVAIGLRIDAFAQPFIAVSLVMAGALQGAGDTRSPMYSTVSGIWLVRVAGIYGLCFWFDLGIAGVWLVNLIDYIFRSAFLFYRFKQLLQD
ncbi:MAG: MATE family efflux transporter [Sporomusaceae bacterium]|nr:MATE family efflux transporter [Sporomusaceae bacterium]